jgi:RNA polymerase sigma-70 factor (ECF subfamily)
VADSTFSFDLAAATSWDGPGASTAASCDARLIEGLCAGDDRAYEELLQRFQQPVYNIVFRLVSDSSDTADVVQEVFLKIFRSIGGFRGRSSLKTWVYRIAVNEAHNHRRWFSRKRGQETGLEDDQGEGVTYEQILPDQGPSPFEIAADQETRAAIEDALANVKPAFREALVLREIEGLTYEEIAEVLQVNINTIKTRIVRGRQSLREQLSARIAVHSSTNQQNAVVGAA